MQHETNEYQSSLSKIFNERTSLCLNAINGERRDFRCGAGVIELSSTTKPSLFFVIGTEVNFSLNAGSTGYVNEVINC